MSEILYKKPTPVFLEKDLLKPSEECWKNIRLKVQDIQKLTKGKGAILAMLDDGIFPNEELVGRIHKSYSYLKTTRDYGPHSTFASTIVGGTKIGIFPEMKFISKKVLDPRSGVGASNSIVSAIYKAHDMGIKTINLSLGSDSEDPALERALKEFCADGQSMVTVASGNDAAETDYPAQYAKKIPGVFSVGATQIDPDGTVSMAVFSSWGVITVAAPGHGLKSMNHKNQIDLVSGTSYSAPILGGTIAVARTFRPNLTQGEVAAVLRDTSLFIEDTTAAHQGFGEIDILSFLTRMKDPKPIKPLTLPREKPAPKKWWQELFRL